MTTEGERGLTPREAYWLNYEPEKIPTSTTLNDEFLRELKSDTLFLDVGCSSGRTSDLLHPLSIQVVGVDINRKALLLGLKKSFGVFIQANGEQLPFLSNKFDGVIMLGILSAVGKEERENIVKDAVRCLKQGGILYVADFARILDPNAYTPNHIKWLDEYKQHEKQTGEYGSTINRNPDGSISFIGHNFERNEMANLITSNGIKLTANKEVIVRGTISGQLRSNWNMWGYKK